MTFFAVQAYRLSGRGVVLEDALIPCRTADQAIRTAERTARSKAGAVAFARYSNEFDEYAEPEFLAAFGRISDQVAEQLPSNLAPIMPA